MNVKVHLNCECFIKLTEEGRRIVKEESAYFADNGDGYNYCQLWELFQVFGSHIKMGGCIPFYDDLIIKNAEQVREPDAKKAA
jgi:hypothetical protein